MGIIFGFVLGAVIYALCKNIGSNKIKFFINR